MAQFLRDWLTRRTDPAGADPLKPSTADGYRRHVEQVLVPALGNIKLPRLAAAEIESMNTGLRSRSRPLAETTIRRINATLHSAVRDAVRLGLIPSDPMVRVKLRPVGKPDLVEWSPSEWLQYAKVAKHDRIWPALVLAADGGLRRGELLGLRWTDVDLDSAKVTVRRSRVPVARVMVEGDPKSERSRRVVHVGGGTVAVLKAWRTTVAKERLALGSAYQSSEYVFVDAMGAPLRPDALSKRHRQLCLLAEVQPCRLHDLRHLSASLGHAAGETPLAISRRLGHASAGFTMDRYSHVFAEHAKEAAEARSDLIGLGAVGAVS